MELCVAPTNPNSTHCVCPQKNKPPQNVIIQKYRDISGGLIRVRILVVNQVLLRIDYVFLLP
ncbi:hypothetical protein Xenpb_00031 [Xenorhabdus sp. PB62.4]|nr:hypothetical protein [Xenorhabdus sp. PB62.4]